MKNYSKVAEWLIKIGLIVFIAPLCILAFCSNILAGLAILGILMLSSGAIILIMGD